MDCERAESLIHEFELGRLGSRPRADLERHLDGCGACCAMMRVYGEQVVNMARSVPRFHAPDRVRQALLARVDSESGYRNPSVYRQVWRFAAFWTIAGTRPGSRKGAAALLMAVSILMGGVWLTQSNDAGSIGGETHSSELGNVAGAGSRLLQPNETATAVAKLVNTQRYSPYGGIRITPPRGTSLSMLSGTEGSTTARGVLITSDGEATLLALNLPPLPSDKVYQIWLVKDGNVVNAGFLTVDATGYGHTVIIPYLSVADYDGIGITIEPASGSADPTGVNVLQGDL